MASDSDILHKKISLEDVREQIINILNYNLTD